jgi:hypothetical protein
MQKLILLIMVMGLSIGSLVAAPKTSTLIIKSGGNELISVAVGEMPFSDAASEVTIRNLKKGRHFVRVMKHTRGVFRSKSEVVYEGYITLRRKREVVAVIDANGSLVILQNEKLKKNQPYYEVEKQNRKKQVHVTVHMGKVISLF